ncbi:MAG: hypothetical protein QM759_03315 [Terricaulis sp.]
MRTVAKSIATYRLQRAHRWAVLWLTWFAAFLVAAADFEPLSKLAQAIAHKRLQRIERLIVAILILRALPHLRGVNRRKGMAERRRIERSFFRAVLGGRLRRALRPKDVHQRIAALRQNIDVLLTQLLKRLPCGLTRRRPIKARPELHHAMAAAVVCMPAPCADTS